MCVKVTYFKGQVGEEAGRAARDQRQPAALYSRSVFTGDPSGSLEGRGSVGKKSKIGIDSSLDFTFYLKKFF